MTNFYSQYIKIPIFIKSLSIINLKNLVYMKGFLIALELRKFQVEFEHYSINAVVTKISPAFLNKSVFDEVMRRYCLPRGISIVESAKFGTVKIRPTELGPASLCAIKYEKKYYCWKMDAFNGDSDLVVLTIFDASPEEVPVPERTVLVFN